MQPTVTVIRSDERHRWRNEWLDSRQSFPATGNFDLAANAHGVLLVHNDDVIDAGEGLDTHQHQDVEIITWVVEGVIRHRDSSGSAGELRPGIVQVMSAGRGIRHSEGNGTSRLGGDEARVVQMWVAPGITGGDPGYLEADFSAALASGDLVPVVSGRGDHADSPHVLPLNNPLATLWAARPPAQRRIPLPAATFGHLYFVSGSANLLGDDGTRIAELQPGDAVRFTDQGGTLAIAADAELLYWEMHGELTRN